LAMSDQPGSDLERVLGRVVLHFEDIASGALV